LSSVVIETGGSGLSTYTTFLSPCMRTTTGSVQT
jgi:hypothetical protein